MTTRAPLLAITLARLVCASLFAVAAVSKQYEFLLPLALLTEASDFADGRVARRLDWTSVVGGVYDSMADHLSRTTEFLALSAAGAIPISTLLVLFWRDGIVITVRLLVLATGGSYASTRRSGKLKGIAQGICLVWISATMSLGHPNHAVSDWLILAMGAVTAISGIDYALANRATLARTVLR